MRVASAVVILSVFSLLGTARAQKDGGADALKGDWSVVSMKMGERSAPDDFVKGLGSSFDGESYTNKAADKVVERGTYTVASSKKPAEIDFAIKLGPDSGKRQLGLFSVDGDTLTLCVSEPGSDRRPASLEPKAEVKAMLIVMKRAKR